MTTFCLKLAGIPIEVHALYNSTKEFCKDYLTEDKALIEITMTSHDIEDMRKRSVRQNELEGTAVISHSDEYLETLALYLRIVEQLLPYNIMLFHGSVVAVDGSAYLFTAESGTGKTTHSQLWLKNIPNCYILNGDKPLILFKEDGIYACGTPWQGKENYGRNEILPLKAIYLLHRDTENHVEGISLHDALPILLSQSYHAKSGIDLIKAIHLIEKLKNLRLFNLGCNMQDQAALVAYHAITYIEL